MNKLTKWFLTKDATTIFLLFFLGIPLYLWFYSIITEFDKKNFVTNSGRKFLTKLVTFFPIIYLPFAIIFISFNIIINDKIGFAKILPFHFFAIFCGLILLVLASGSLTKYERNKNVESLGNIGNFFLLWFYIFGVWILQPKINKYSE